MHATTAVPALLDVDQVAFLGEPVAINVASRDAALTPSVARAYGCRVSSDRRQVTVFLSLLRSRGLLRDLRAGAPIAVVFTRPVSHRSLQLKAATADVEPLAPADQALMRAYGEAFCRELLTIDAPEHVARAMTQPVDDESVAVTFSPAAVFDQTPGPSAGKRLGAGS